MTIEEEIAHITQESLEKRQNSLNEDMTPVSAATRDLALDVVEALRNIYHISYVWRTVDGEICIALADQTQRESFVTVYSEENYV